MTQKKTNWAYLVNSLVTLGIMLGFSLLPAPGTITPLGMQILGIFIALIYGWSTVGTIWPSLAGILAMGFTDYATVPEAIMQAMGNDVVWQLLLIMAMLVPVENEGVANHISKFFLNLSIVKGRPWAFSAIFLFATYVLSASTSGTATILLMWAILYSILRSVGYTIADRYTSLMIFGVVYASILGFATFPFKGPALAILRSYAAASGQVMDNALYMAVVIPTTLVMLAGYLLAMRVIFRPDTGKLKNIDLKAYFDALDLHQMNRRQRVLLGVLCTSILLMFLPSIMSKSWALTIFLQTLGSSGVMVLIVTVMIAVRVESKPLLNFKQAAAQIQWGIVFLVMAALFVAGALCSEGTGVTDYFHDVLYPVLGGRSLAVFSLLGVLSGTVITNFGNNAAMGVVLMPLIHALAAGGDFNPLIPVALVTMSVFVAVITPVASPHAALLHGNREWISGRHVYLYAVSMTLWSVFVTMLVGLPLARLVFGS
ncbi:SLC13 family permease [Peptococcus simiae]|uniref:SLC13 family permease n=1 Tax=Peptococcus simiae TaxID=1643805 RepID=UPI00398088E4